jgi:methionyl-tRNA synthetase
MTEATIEDVKKLGLKVGVVKAAEAVPKTTKLLKLLVDLGDEERTLVAGIALRYKPEELVGRRVVVVANLAPAMIRGIESCGMILAASTGDRIELVSPDGDSPAGAEVR